MPLCAVASLVVLHQTVASRARRQFQINYNYAFAGPGPTRTHPRHVLVMRAGLTGRRAIVALGRPRPKKPPDFPPS
jgi:hypothetical protein